jgi:hypothetical protein
VVTAYVATVRAWAAILMCDLAVRRAASTATRTVGRGQAVDGLGQVPEAMKAARM